MKFPEEDFLIPTRIRPHVVRSRPDRVSDLKMKQRKHENTSFLTVFRLMRHINTYGANIDRVIGEPNSGWASGLYRVFSLARTKFKTTQGQGCLPLLCTFSLKTLCH